MIQALQEFVDKKGLKTFPVNGNSFGIKNPTPMTSEGLKVLLQGYLNGANCKSAATIKTSDDTKDELLAVDVQAVVDGKFQAINISSANKEKTEVTVTVTVA